MAIHRAVFLANPASTGSGPTLLLTFDNSLLRYLKHLAKDHRAGVTIETYARFARGYLNSRGVMGFGKIASASRRQQLIEVAIAIARTTAYTKFLERPIPFFLDEIEWIDANGLATISEYLVAVRVGRQAPLQEAHRRAVWAIREAYIALRASAGLDYDWPSLPSAVNAQLTHDLDLRRYKHIVVDEAQDLGPEAIRSLASAIPPGGSLTLFADYAQQIYGQRVSWRSCGLSVARVEEFLDNYRNSPEIARLALEMAKMPHFRDSVDLVEPRTPARAAGAKPTLVSCASPEDEARQVAQIASVAGRIGRVGILARTRKEARAAVSGLSGVTMLYDDYDVDKWSAPNGIYAGTYHSGKGLEFDVVVMPYCSSDRRPDAEAIAAFGEEEAASRESRLMYVGVTRAKSELVITHTGQLTPLLPLPETGLYEVTV